MITRNITISASETHQSGKFSTFSLADLGTAADTLIAMRMTVHGQACLANHMDREGLEDYLDVLVSDLNDDLGEIEKELLFRDAADQAEAADVEDLLVKIAFATRPGERGWSLRSGGSK